jgi:polysaccharide export outer membrane protein
MILVILPFMLVCEADEIYRITVGDKLDVDVFEEDELSVQREVKPEGVVTLPYVEKINVLGKTLSEAEKSIAKAYRDQEYLKRPEITVTVASYKKRTVSVLGSVGLEGQVSIPDGKRKIELLAAVAAAGGFEKIANKRKVEIIRAGHKEPIAINVYELYKRKTLVYLFPGDVLNVRQRWF